MQMEVDAVEVPVELKPSDNTQSRSLSAYRSKYAPEQAVRLSTKHFGIDNGIRSVPLHAAYCMGDTDC
ncbi:ATPase [Bifidobacterium leontopitheci]|uniref:ATPase n=2 Tax=Bifidobacterium leontopitheci TaxID=2650774 RepID=A0A6I1GEF8_9BIFI|nr:ATPase [Bifidobacterium leontopitheci]